MADPNTPILPNPSGPMPYLALSFAPIKGMSGNRIEWDFGQDIVTEFSTDPRDKKTKPGNPFEVRSGKYYLSLKTLRDGPIEDGRYLHKEWHMEPEDSGVIAKQEHSIILVVRNLIRREEGTGETHKFVVRGTGNCELRLGEIYLPPGSHEYEVVGDLHTCFWHSQESWMAGLQSFKERPKGHNLKYHIKSV